MDARKQQGLLAECAEDPDAVRNVSNCDLLLAFLHEAWLKYLGGSALIHVMYHGYVPVDVDKGVWNQQNSKQILFVQKQQSNDNCDKQGQVRLISSFR